MSAVRAVTSATADSIGEREIQQLRRLLALADAQRRLREWGDACGQLDEVSRRPYRDTTLKQMHDIGEEWRRSRELKEEKRRRKKAASLRLRALAEARKRGQVHKCERCGHLFLLVCRRCKGDPKYTALGNQPHSFTPAPVAVVESEIDQTDAVVGAIRFAWMREVLQRVYLKSLIPWRVHAKQMRVTQEEFERQHEAAVVEFMERLAMRKMTGL